MNPMVGLVTGPPAVVGTMLVQGGTVTAAVCHRRGQAERSRLGHTGLPDDQSYAADS